MPQVYEKIRDKLSKKMNYDEAQKHAAMIYNALRRKHPSMQKLSNKKNSK